jgi:transcriptional regulator with XRE-family HTH domain
MRSKRRTHAAAAVGEQVAHLRQQLRLSQADLADATGLSQQYISEIERGLKLPEVEAIDTLSRALGVLPYHLRVLAGFSGTDAPSVDPQEAELVGIYRSLPALERQRIVRVLRELARPA